MKYDSSWGKILLQLWTCKTSYVLPKYNGVTLPFQMGEVEEKEQVVGPMQV